MAKGDQNNDVRGVYRTLSNVPRKKKKKKNFFPLLHMLKLYIRGNINNVIANNKIYFPAKFNTRLEIFVAPASVQ
jgi:hypothetical protein